jgi:hypothetical protein
VLEKASSILKNDRLECSAQRFDQGFPAPSPRLAKKALYKMENVGSEEGEIPRRASQEIGGWLEGHIRRIRRSSSFLL